MKLMTILFLSLLAAVQITAFAGKAIPLNRVVAVVNNEVITQTDLNQAMNLAQQQMQQAHMTIPNNTLLREQVLDQMIYKKLQLQIAERANLKVTDKEIDNAIQQIAQRNHVTLNELKSVIAKQGTSYPTYRQQISEQVLFSRLQQQALGGANINVTDAEIKNFIHNHANQTTGNKVYSIQDILIPLSSSPSKNQLKVAQSHAGKIINTLKKGGDISKLINEASAQSNDLGWRTLADLPDIFAATLLKINSATAVGPIKAPNGLHVLRVSDVRNQNSPPISKEQARQVLYEQKAQGKFKTWLENLRKTAYVKVM